MTDALSLILGQDTSDIQQLFVEDATSDFNYDVLSLQENMTGSTAMRRARRYELNSFITGARAIGRASTSVFSIGAGPTTFQTDRMLKILDESVAIIREEMPREIARWGIPGSMSTWNKSVATLRRITTEKRALMIATLQHDFGLSQATMKELFPKDFE